MLLKHGSLATPQLGQRRLAARALGTTTRCGVVRTRAAATELVAPTAAADLNLKSSQHGAEAPNPAAAPAAADAPSTYNWTAHWWPVAPLNAIDPAKPYPITMLGHNYVVWYNKQQDSWQLMEDRCPHRLAPLSEGRVEANGHLACAYHGWEFDTQGACKKIPQLGDPAAAAAACANPRSCVATYPTKVVNGLLFAWLEAGPTAAAAAAAEEPHMPQEAFTPFPWGWNQLPVDYSYWASQAMDPTHANFLHVSFGFKPDSALPMEAETLPPAQVDLQKGFTWHHGAYDKKTQGLQAERQFLAPNCIRVAYDRGMVGGAVILSTPVTPGVSRVFAKFVVRPPPPGAAKAPGPRPPPLLFRLMGQLPHWASVSTMLTDQDLVMNLKQERYMRSIGATSKDQYQPARADVGVRAADAWLDMAGYDSMWQQRLGLANSPAAAASAAGGADHAATASNSSSSSSHVGQEDVPAPSGTNSAAEASPSSSSGSSGGTASSSGNARDRGARGPWAGRGYQAPSDEDIFNVWTRHTQHCAVCLQGLKTLQQFGNTLSLAAALLGVAAVALTVAAKTFLNLGSILAAAAAGACLWARQKVLWFRHDRLLNSQHYWDKAGGLSLVKGGTPIRLPAKPSSSSYPL